MARLPQHMLCSCQTCSHHQNAPLFYPLGSRRIEQHPLCHTSLASQTDARLLSCPELQARLLAACQSMALILCLFRQLKGLPCLVCLCQGLLQAIPLSPETCFKCL